MILQWDHSKRSTYKSPHTSSIWGLTWNRWSHSSICNKNDANNIFSGWYKIGFEIKNEIEGQGQSSPKFSGTLRVLRCIIGPNLEILSWIGGEWCHGQAQNMAIFYFEVKFDLEVQGQLTPKTIGILIKVFCSSGSNLVILAWTGDKLSSGQASDYRTNRRTHRQTQATTIPEGQNWPRVKRCDRQTDGRTERGVLRAAWSQQKTLCVSHSVNLAAAHHIATVEIKSHCNLMHQISCIIPFRMLFPIVWVIFYSLWLFHIFMPYKIILYLRLPYIHVSNSALFSTEYFCTLIL